MIDWAQSMQQTFEYYEVDPTTWKDKKKIDNILSCSINSDSSADTLGSASISAVNMFGECYVRIYLVAIQNGIKERIPLGTYLIQTPSTSFDGKIKTVNIDAYTPLIELNENTVPLGYGILKNSDIFDEAITIVRNNCRAPITNMMRGTDVDPETGEIIVPKITKKLENNFIANTDDTYLTYVRDLLGLANYHLSIDGLGNILFAPTQIADELQPKWTYSDDNSSILYPQVQITHDIYGMPNVVEIENKAGTEMVKIVNDDPNSPISTVNRGREIVYRNYNPSNLRDNATYEELEQYAKELLKSASAIEYSLSYTHGYCPVKIDDCVRLNYKRMDINNVKARVTSQSISCTPGCPVSETAVFTKNVWVIKTDIPYSYDALEYIQNRNEENFVPTNVNPNNNTHIIIDFKLDGEIEVESYLYRSLNDKYTLKINSDNSLTMNYNETELDIDVELLDNTLYRIDLNRNVLTIYSVGTSTTVTYEHTFQNGDFNESSLYIFNIPDTNSYPNIKLYSCTVYDDGKLVRQFIPARKKITGDLGLLDYKNNKFYKGNIQEHDETVIDPETEEPVVIHVEGIDAGPIVDFPE